jgi:hypothetical protein
MTWRITALAIAGVLGVAVQWAWADDSCAGYKWNIEHERSLFARGGRSLAAGADASSAPVIPADQLLEVALLPESDVHYALPPSKRPRHGGAYAGLVRLQLTAPALYRISLDQADWIDVIVNHESLKSVDFAGQHACTAPRKIVTFNLPAGEVLLQLSAATTPHVRVSITRAP